MVRRLDFSVEEFVRIIWVSNEARFVWEPRISSVSRMYQELEITSVHAGIKRASLQTCSPANYIDIAFKASQVGLVALPVDIVNIESTYSNASKLVDDRKPKGFRVIIGRDEVTRNFLLAWKERDDVAIGEILGYPLCCRQFFQKYWVNENFRDLTYPMVLNEAHADNHYLVNGPISCNILLRWLGVRRVSHLPCSFECENTRTVGNRVMNLAKDLFPRETMLLDEMLDWPIRYSSLHGVAIITTPVLRIVTSTDPLADRVIIDRDGSHYPPEGAGGLEFPFKTTYPIKLRRKPMDTWTDSGFQDEKSMNDAHAVVLRLLTNVNLYLVKNVIDLGSGSGVLLEKIGKILPVQLYGIEKDDDRYHRAAQRIASSQLVIFHMDLMDYSWTGPHGLALISLNRLLEIDSAMKDVLLDRISKHCNYLILYSYDGKELNVSWSEFFRFVHAERENSTNAYLLKSLYANQEDPETRLQTN